MNLLGVDEAADGRERLLEIFQEGLNAPEITKGRKLTKYGLNISRKVEVSYGEVEGAIVVRYFYPNGDLSVKPQVTSIVVLIYKWVWSKTVDSSGALPVAGSPQTPLKKGGEDSPPFRKGGFGGDPAINYF